MRGSDKKPRKQSSKLTHKGAIKAKCLDCCCDQKKEVKLCPIDTCPLWEFRPFQGRDKSEPTPEQEAKNKERMAKARAARKKKDEGSA